jgi:uncharacterized protein YaeQ
LALKPTHYELKISLSDLNRELYDELPFWIDLGEPLPERFKEASPRSGSCSSFLWSEDASYITGALLPVEGGVVAGQTIEFMESGDTGQRI